MAFNFFSKKKSKDMDLTGSVSGGIPLPKHLQKKLVPIKPNDGIITLSDTSSQTAPETQPTTPASSGGGFFNFFGNSSPSSYDATPSQPADSSYPNNLQETNKISEFSDRLSKLLDRVELIERKIERLERKNY
jgi:hypothetical protein